MKTTLILFFVVVNSFGFSQTRIESDYVFEGKTFEYALKDDFIKLEGFEEELFNVFLLDTIGVQAIIEDEYLESLPFNEAIIIGFREKNYEDEGLINFLDDLDNLTEEDFKIKPVVSYIGSYSLLTTQVTLAIDDLLIQSVNLGVLDFGDYFFIFVTINVSKEKGNMMKALFDRIVSSIKIIPTTKENGLKDYEYFDRNSRNGYVETNVDYKQLTFDKESSKYWETGSKYGFLTSYVYGPPDASILGSVDILSAGLNSAEFKDEELKTYLNAHDLLEVNFSSFEYVGLINGVDFTLKKHNVKEEKNKGLNVIYTTILEGELLVFFIDNNNIKASGFSKYSESFVQSMHYGTKPK
jgi:hypothetical protein